MVCCELQGRRTRNQRGASTAPTKYWQRQQEAQSPDRKRREVALDWDNVSDVSDERFPPLVGGVFEGVWFGQVRLSAAVQCESEKVALFPTRSPTRETCWNLKVALSG